MLRANGVLWVTQDFVERLPEVSAMNAEAQVARQFNDLRRSARKQPLPLYSNPRLRELACEMAHHDSVSAARAGSLPNVARVVALAAANLARLPAFAHDTVTAPASGLSVGVCYASKPHLHGSGLLDPGRHLFLAACFKNNADFVQGFEGAWLQPRRPGPIKMRTLAPEGKRLIPAGGPRFAFFRQMWVVLNVGAYTEPHNRHSSPELEQTAPTLGHPPRNLTLETLKPETLKRETLKRETFLQFSPAIWSRAESLVLLMPETFSLKSSGFDAFSSAVSIEISPPFSS